MSKKVQNIVSGIILTVFAVSLLVFGVWYSQDHDAKLKNCTEQVTAEVIENIENTEEEQVSDHEYELTKNRYKQIKVFKSVFEYEYDGKTYIKEGKKTKYSPFFQVGEEVELKINPSAPYEFYVAGDNSYNSSIKILLGLSGFFLIFAIFMFIKAK